MYYGNLTNQKVFSYKINWFFIIVLEIFWAILCVVLPYYLIIPFFVYFIVLILILIRPKWGIYPLIFLVPIISNYIGFYSEASSIIKKLFRFNNYIDYMPFYMLISLPAFFSLILSELTGFKSYFVRSKINLLFLILFFWNFLLLICSPNIIYSTVPFFNFTINILLYYLLVFAIDEEGFHRKLMWCCIFVGLIMSSVVCISCFFEFKFEEKIVLWEGLSFSANVRNHIRGRGQCFGHPNETSLILNLLTCVSIGMVLCEKNKIKKLICKTSLLFFIFANFLTMSKSGTLAFLAMIHFLLFSIRSLRKKLFWNLILLNSTWIFLFFLGIKFISETKAPRLFAGGSNAELSITSRLEMWKEGTSNLLNNSLGIGLGPGGFRYYTHTGMPSPHSFYVSILCDLGFVGLLILFLVILIIVKNYLQVFRHQDTYSQVMFICCCGGLIAMGVQGLIDSSYISSFNWLFLGLSVSAFHLARKGLVHLKEGS